MTQGRSPPGETWYSQTNIALPRPNCLFPLLMILVFPGKLMRNWL